MDQDVTDNVENNSQSNGEISARSSDCGDLSVLCDPCSNVAPPNNEVSRPRPGGIVRPGLIPISPVFVPIFDNPCRNYLSDISDLYTTHLNTPNVVLSDANFKAQVETAVLNVALSQQLHLQSQCADPKDVVDENVGFFV